MLDFMKTILSAVKTYIDNTAERINKKIPTKNSQLENDSNFATVDSVPKNISALNNDMKYIIAETDPTVPDWAKQETKPEYTAEEVGALPNTLTTLPNPEFLRISTIAAHYTYDGSDSVKIDIPMDINCVGKKSIAFNNVNDASGEESFAQGRGTKSSGMCSFSEGMGCTASGIASHAQGCSSIAHGAYSYASGLSTIASNKSLSTLGRYNLSEYITSEFAIFNYSYNITYGNPYHIDRNKIFIYGDSFSFNTETGLFTIENGIESENFTNDFINKFFIKIDEQNVMYKVIYMLNDYSFSADCYTSYNISENYGNYSFIIGNGTDDSNRSNAHTLDWEGNAWYSGDVYVGSTSGTNRDDGSKKLATEEYVDNIIDEKAFVKQMPVFRIESPTSNNLFCYINIEDLLPGYLYIFNPDYSDEYPDARTYVGRIVVVCEDGSEKNVANVSKNGSTVYDIMKSSNTFMIHNKKVDMLFNIDITDRSTANNVLVNTTYNVSYLRTNNVTEYIPTDQYHPTTKKYVDDVKTEMTTYTDTAVANLVNSAPETLDTIGELATAFEENKSVVETLDAAITNKLDASIFAEHLTSTELFLSSPNGTKFQITIGDDGVLSATEITE